MPEQNFTYLLCFPTSSKNAVFPTIFQTNLPSLTDAEQEVRGSIPRLATWVSEIGYLLLPSHDMAEIPLKRRKTPIQQKQQQQQYRLQSINVHRYLSSSENYRQ